MVYYKQIQVIYQNNVIWSVSKQTPSSFLSINISFRFFSLELYLPNEHTLLKYTIADTCTCTFIGERKKKADGFGNLLRNIKTIRQRIITICFFFLSFFSFFLSFFLSIFFFPFSFLLSMNVSVRVYIFCAVAAISRLQIFLFTLHRWSWKHASHTYTSVPTRY